MKFSVIDIEGTDGNASKSRIMEIAVYVYENGQTTDAFSTLVNPGTVPDFYVRKLTGITPKMLKRAPKFHEIAKRLVEMTEGTVLVAHNAPYDYGMLRKEFKRLGYAFNRPYLDTVRYSEKLLPGMKAYGLDALTKALRIPVTDRHRAYGDARATLKLLQILTDKDPDLQVMRQMIVKPGEAEGERDIRPSLLKQLDRLPEQRGIVYFYGDGGKLLYVAYTGNIRRKAEKILAAAGRRGKNLRRLTRTVSGENMLSPVAARIKTMVIRKQKNPPYSPHRKCKDVPPLPLENALLLHFGKDENSRSFYLIENRRLTGYGFTGLHYQTADPSSLRKRMYALDDCPCARKLIGEKLKQKNYFEIINPYPVDE